MRSPHLLQLSLSLASTLLAACLCSRSGSAQSLPPTSVTAAPQAVLDSLLVRTASVQDLVLPHGSDAQSLVFAFDPDGDPRTTAWDTVKLERFSMLSEDFKLLVDDGSGPQSVPYETPSTYRGSLTQRARSDAALSWREGGIRGVMSASSGAGQDARAEQWVVQPLRDFDPTARAASHVFFRTTDLLPDPGRGTPICEGVRGLPPGLTAGGSIAPNPLAASTGPADQCEIALDCDFGYFQRQGSSVSATQDAILDLMQIVDAIYRREVSICYEVTAIVVRTAPVYTLGPNFGCTPGSPPGLLDEMVTVWRAQQLSTPRDIAHLVSGQGAALGAAGCAFFDGICASEALGFGYGVTRAVASSLFLNASLIAHELGHNWSAQHCDGTPGCGLMCATLGLCGPYDNFGPTTRSVINQFRNLSTCLSQCEGCNEQASVDIAGIPCPGSGTGAGDDCVNLNFNTTNANLVYNSQFLAAIPAPQSTQTQAIESLDFFVRALVPLTIQVEILAADPLSGLPAESLGITDLDVGLQLATYRATFALPVAIPGQTDFYVGVHVPGPDFIVPFSSPGAGITPVTWQFLSVDNTWFEQPQETWHFRANCTGANASPLISALGRPQLDENFSVTLDAARPNSPVSLLWSAIPVEASLAILGAPECSILVSDPFTNIGGMSDANGHTSWPFSVPNDAMFCGLTFFQQALVIDPQANALQLAFSSRSAVRIGN